MKPLKTAVIVGSTREARFGMKPAQWIADVAGGRDDLDVELVDLQDFDLPMFNEVASNAWAPSSDPRAVAWQKKVAEFDAYIVVTPEYNRSVPGALKNAFDQAYVEWQRKPVGFLGYGAVGGARAVEHGRLIAVELQMVPVRAGVHIGGSEFMKVHPMGEDGPISEIEGAIRSSADAMLDDLVWWGTATRDKRTAEAG